MRGYKILVNKETGELAFTELLSKDCQWEDITSSVTEEDAIYKLEKVFLLTEEEYSKKEELLQECNNQLEYLNQKFGETGTTNSLLSRLKTLMEL